MFLTGLSNYPTYLKDFDDEDLSWGVNYAIKKTGIQKFFVRCLCKHFSSAHFVSIGWPLAEHKVISFKLKSSFNDVFGCLYRRLDLNLHTYPQVKGYLKGG